MFDSLWPHELYPARLLCYYYRLNFVFQKRYIDILIPSPFDHDLFETIFADVTELKYDHSALG